MTLLNPGIAEATSIERLQCDAGNFFITFSLCAPSQTSNPPCGENEKQRCARLQRRRPIHQLLFDKKLAVQKPSHLRQRPPKTGIFDQKSS
jgi:hypothetical protein